MELPSKILEQMAFNTRSKIENMLIVMDKSTHEEHYSQPIQTNNKRFKIAVTFLIGYNGILMLLIEIINSLSQEHLTVMILVLFLFYQALSNSRA